MNLLGIDTCTGTVDVALVIDEVTVSTRRGTAPRRQLTALMPMISEIMEEGKLKVGDLDFIGVTRGPGSFTGIRLGLATAKTLAQAAGVRMVAINTIDALAAGCPRDGLVAASLDARKGEIFYGLYRKTGQNVQLQGGYQRAPVEDYLTHLNSLDDENIVVVGTVWDRLEKPLKEGLTVNYHRLDDLYNTPRGEIVARMAEEIARNGNFVDYGAVNADYMRDFVAIPPSPLI